MVWNSELARRILPGPCSAPAGDKPLALHFPAPTPLDSGLRRDDEWGAGLTAGDREQMDLVVGKGTSVTPAPGPDPTPAGDEPPHYIDCRETENELTSWRVRDFRNAGARARPYPSGGKAPRLA